MFWFTQGLCFLPAFLVVWSSCTFVVSYLIAIYRRDVDVIFPYISDTGATPPESCIFGLMTFITAYAGLATVYARYKFVQKLGEATQLVNPRLNKAALAFGMLSCLGMCVVATFQKTTVSKVHIAGALLFFVTGVIYIILQSIISYHAFPFGSSITVCRVRLSIAIVAAVAFFPSVICGGLVKQNSLHEDPAAKDYPFHLTSTICEWITAFSFIFFFYTYIGEFKRFSIRVVTEWDY